jgi:hypothetical protein
MFTRAQFGQAAPVSDSVGVALELDAVFASGVGDSPMGAPQVSQ